MVRVVTAPVCFVGPCLLHQCAQNRTCNINPGDTFVGKYFGLDLTVVPTLHKYTLSVYFINFTIFTVGYGDVGPQNYAERIFICVVLVWLWGYWDRVCSCACGTRVPLLPRQ